MSPQMPVPDRTPRAAESPWRRTERFPRWRLCWWLLFAVEDSLARLPMLLLGPTVGAIIGTAVAVSELKSVRVDRHVVAAVPSVGDVLWPALLGGLGGVAVLALLSALWAIGSYLARGDSTWKAVMTEPGDAMLVCRGEPVGLEQLGAVECVVRRPEGIFRRAALQPRANPHGGAPNIDAPFESGEYEVRYYATENRGHIHELGRTKCKFVSDA